MPPRRRRQFGDYGDVNPYTYGPDPGSGEDYNPSPTKRPHLSNPTPETHHSQPTMPHIPDFTEHLKSGAFSDCEVKCAGRVWKLHKLILCSRSKFFEAALTGNFSEANKGVVTLEEQDPDTVHDVFRYLYSGNLLHLEETIEFPCKRGFNDLSLWLPWYEKYTAIYVLADFLALPDLSDEILNRLREVNQKLKEGVASTGQCIGVDGDFSKKFGACVKLAYSLPLREQSTSKDGATSNSVKPSGSIRTTFVQFLIAAGLRSLKKVLKDLETSEPQILVDIILATT